jgi:hypothetical protein
VFLNFFFQFDKVKLYPIIYIDYLDLQSLYLVLYKIEKFDNFIVDLVFVFSEEDPIVVGISIQDIDVPTISFLRQRLIFNNIYYNLYKRMDN